MAGVKLDVVLGLVSLGTVIRSKSIYITFYHFLLAHVFSLLSFLLLQLVLLSVPCFYPDIHSVLSSILFLDVDLEVMLPCLCV